MSSIGEELPNQITRVRKIQDEFKELRSMPGVMVEPQIIMMEHSIQAAIRAQGSGDIIEILRCYKDLEGYSE